MNEMNMEVERELCRIPDVSAARIVDDATGRPVEVHILATPTKHAKQIVRDVQSVAMAAYGLDLDRRIISVVQLDSTGVGNSVKQAIGNDTVTDADAPDFIDLDMIAATTAATNGSAIGNIDTAQSPEPRVELAGVICQQSGTHCSVEVALERNEERVVGVAEGLSAMASTRRLTAEATLLALRQFEPDTARTSVETATILRVGERRVAVTSIVFVTPPHEEILAGSAVVRSAGEPDAIARAVLAATNRRLLHAWGTASV